MENTIKRDKHEVDMVNGNLFKNLIIVAIPLVLSGILQLFYTSADLIVCNIFGSPNSTAAISSTNALVNLIVNTFIGLSVGTNILMSRYYGANVRKYAQRNVYTSMILAAVIGIFVGVFGCTLSKYFLIWMNSPEDVIDLSTQYLSIYFLGVPFTLVYNFGAAILRATGDTKRPFFVLLIAGIVNIGFNLLFVVVFKMDVAGVALGTVISQCISAVAIVILLTKKDGFYHFKFKELKFYKYEAIEILKIGIPAGLQNSIFSISNVILQSSINSLGSSIMGVAGAANSLEGFIFTAMNSINESSVAFVSANYGAKRKDNIKKVLFMALGIVFAISFLVGIPLLLLKEPLFKLYVNELFKTHQYAAIQDGYNKFTMIVLTYFICGFMGTFAHSIRGIKHATLPTIVTLVGTCGTRILWKYVFFPMPQLHSLMGLMISYPLSWTVTLITHIIFYIILYKRIKFEDIKDE